MLQLIAAAGNSAIVGKNEATTTTKLIRGFFASWANSWAVPAVSVYVDGHMVHGGV